MHRAARIDVSTKAAVIHYLRSIHVNAKGAVIQRGLRNYAGAHCPGKSWTCAATRRTVVQIAKHGGQNRFVCKSSKCVVVQISGTSHGLYASGRRFSTAAANNGGGNSGVCVKNGSGSPTGTGQSCTIIQSGSGPNTAVVWENSQKVAGLTTSLTFTAVITQTATGTSQGNTACVTQNINLDGSTTGLKGKPVTATLEAHQSVAVTQDSSTGPNIAANAAVLSGTTAICDPNSTNLLGQNQTLSSTINGTAKITQNENAVDGSPNVALDIKQNQSQGFKGFATGVNKASFNQTNTLTAIANGPSGVQVQSSPTEGGILAAVNQDSSGLSTATAVQTEEQCEDASTSGGLTTCDHNADSSAAGFTQTQYGPAGLAKSATSRHGRHFHLLRKTPGDSFQTGNDQDKFTVTQTSHQWNDSGSHQSNVIAGGITTAGTGTVTQNTLIQNTPKKNVHQGDNTTVNGNIDCSGSSCTKNLSAPTITAKPPNPDTFGNVASFSFSNVDDSVAFICSIDGAAYVACGNAPPSGLGTQTYSGLVSGTHTFAVKTLDPTNPDTNTNKSVAASYTWVITPPDPTITAKPTDPSPSTTPSFSFDDTDTSVGFKCQIDGGGYTTCTSPKSYTLSAGQHTFDVKAVSGDTTATSGVKSYTWTIQYIVFDGSPGTGAPPLALGPYGMTAFGADSQPSCFAPGSSVTGVNDPAGTIGFSEAVNHFVVSPTCWLTWSHGYTGDVYSTDSSTNTKTLTITLPAATQAFYLYSESVTRSPFTITANAQDGTTSGPITVNGDGGARYFGFYELGGATLASITVTTDDSSGLGVGEFGISVAP